MKNFKKLILLASLTLLTACGSTPSNEPHYFALTPSQNTASSSISSSNAIALKPIRLAKYLDQPGIVLQIDQHEIKVAHYHRWAEPLKHNLHRYIAQSIGINDIRESSKTLEIYFQNFHGMQNGSALVSGHWVYNQIQHPFSYQAPLTTSGYTELVKQLALLLDQLCADIAAQTI